MKRAALGVLALSVIAIGVAYGGVMLTGRASAWNAWVMAMATPFAMIATMTLGAARADKPAGGLRKLILPFAVVLLIMLGAFAAALSLPAEGESFFLGLPLRAAIVLYGIGVVPVFILPLAYALTFDEITLTEDDIERVRQAALDAGVER